MNAISALRAVVTGTPEPWTKPEFSMPVPLAGSDLVPLGQDLRTGRFWYSVPRRPQLGELAERIARLGPNDVLPDLPIVEETDADGRREVVVYDVFAPGTFARIGTLPVREKPTRDHKPVDRLSLVALADRQPERIFAPAPRSDNVLLGGNRRPNIRPASPPARGAEAILERLQSAGADVRLSSSGDHLVVTAEGGRPRAGVVELVELTERLLVGYLSGQPVACEVGPHKKPVPAVSIVLGGAAACADCLGSTKR